MWVHLQHEILTFELCRSFVQADAAQERVVKREDGERLAKVILKVPFSAVKLKRRGGGGGGDENQIPERI